MQVDRPYFTLGSRESVLKGEDDPIVKAYKKFMFDTATKMGGKPAERIRNNVESIFTFEERLAEVCLVVFD